MKNEILNVFPEMSTERLNLRQIRQEDAESIYKILSKGVVITMTKEDCCFTNENKWFRYRG